MLIYKSYMKKLLILLLLTACSCSSYAYNAFIDGIYYTLNSNTKEAVVTSGNTEYSGAIKIPEKVSYNGNEYLVTIIGQYAFSYSSGITSVIIPNSVVSIGSGAFYNCSGISSVTIPNSVTSIGDNAFAHCSNVKKLIYAEGTKIALRTYLTSITSVTIPSSVTSIGNYAFYGCSNLISVSVPDLVTSIGDYAFYGCKILTRVTIPNSVTTIGDGAFYGCEGLVSAIIPKSVSRIGGRTFSDCFGLTSVSIPSSVTSIGDYAFKGCYSLVSLAIPNSVTSIGSYAFSDCSLLTSLPIPSSVTSIGSYAFSGCYNLMSLIIPNSITTINSGTCAGCLRLTSLTIPNSVTSIGENAFSECSALTSVIIPNSVTSIGTSAFFGSGLTSVTIPNSVTDICSSAFRGCPRLTSVTIGNSVTSIGYEAFRDCSNLTSVTIGNSVTSIENYAFEGCYNISNIYWNSPLQYTFGSRFRGTNEIHYGDDIIVAYKVISSTEKLNKVVVGKNVEYIREYAFNGAPLRDFFITGVKDIYLYSGAFDNVKISNCTLYVPKSRAEYYKTTAPWRDFGKIVDLDGNDFPEVTKHQCDAPIIEFVDGQLRFSCSTPNATYSYTITDEDIKTSLTKSITGNIPLSATYKITAYAEVEGYEVSEPTTATLHWIDGTLDSNDGIKSVGGAKRGVLVSSHDGMIKASGLNDGEKVEAYTIDGKYIGSANTVDNAAYISVQSGEVVVLKIGKGSIKTIVR